MERRLTTILAYDAVGYSRAIGIDESGTLARLKADRRDVIEAKAEQHGGRTIKLMGDGGLMEFASVVDAVAFAVRVQVAISERDARLPVDQRLRYRIGINVGDVVVEGGDIFGDGVNVAARLEGLAEPGGICIRRNVRNHVRGKLDLDFQDLGGVEVKNIARPIRAFHIVMNEKAAALAAATVTHGRRSQRSTRLWQAAAGLALIAAAAVLWFQPWAPRQEPVSVEAMAYPLPDKPSIAVLPFDNMSGDPEQEYFADGITEDIITDLSKLSGLFVIARNSSFAYKGRPVKIARVAAELGVRYVLDGSVRRAGDQVRINAQLIDATTGGHVWAERFDRPIRDIFSLQNEITARIVAALTVNINRDDELRLADRAPENVAAYDEFLQGWHHYRQATREGLQLARRHFEKAIELDPEYALAYAALARVYDYAWNRRWSVDLGWSDARCKIERYLDRAMSQPTPLAHVTAANKRLVEHRFDTAVAEIDRAVALSPNDPEVLGVRGWILTMTGRPEEGLDAVERAIRLDPSGLARKKWVAGVALFSVERYVEALAAFEIARGLNATLAAWPHAATLVRLGRQEDAKNVLLEYLKLRGWSDASELQQAFRDIEDRAFGSVGGYLAFMPFKQAEDTERLGLALVMLGMCCEREVAEIAKKLRSDGHARSPETESHLASLQEGSEQGCASGN